MDVNEARDNEWHLLDDLQILCTSLETGNHASNSSLNYLQAGCSSCRPTNSEKKIKALTANTHTHTHARVRFNKKIHRTDIRSRHTPVLRQINEQINKCVSRLARRKSHRTALRDAVAPNSDCPASLAAKFFSAGVICM